MKKNKENCQWFIKPIGSDSNGKIAGKLGIRIYDSEETDIEAYRASFLDVKSCFFSSPPLKFIILNRVGENGKLVDVTKIVRQMLFSKEKKKAKREFKRMKK